MHYETSPRGTDEHHLHFGYKFGPVLVPPMRLGPSFFAPVARLDFVALDTALRNLLSDSTVQLKPRSNVYVAVH